MATKKNYLPQAYALLLIWLLNFMEYLIANMQRFGIPTGAADELKRMVNDFQAAQLKAESPNAGKADRVYRKEKAAAVSGATRHFVNARLRYNDAVTDEDRVKMGLTVPDRKPTTAPEIKTQPEVYRIDSSVIMRIALYYKNTGDLSRARPYGTHGVEIRSAILDHQPVTTDDMKRSDFSTRSPYTFVFDENQRGKTIWFRLRWENTRGHKGPWSEIYVAIIP